MLDSCLCGETNPVEKEGEGTRITYWERSTGTGLGIAGKRDFKLREFRAAKVQNAGSSSVNTQAVFIDL